MCKRITSPGFFYIFSKFSFFGSLVGEKGKKCPIMTKNYVCLTPYLRKHTFLVDMSKIKISPTILIFFPNSDFFAF